MRRLARELGTTLDAAEETRRRLLPLRKKLNLLDELTWNERKVTGAENHLWLVSSSDFGGDPVSFEKNLARAGCL
jgi:hypothetical protein